MNVEAITIISADISTGRQFVLVHSDDLLEQEIGHGFVIERMKGRWQSAFRQNVEIRSAVVFDGHLLLNSTSEIFDCELSGSGLCADVPTPPDMELINRINAHQGFGLVLGADSSLFRIELAGGFRFEREKTGLDDAGVLMDSCQTHDQLVVVGMDGLYLAKRQGASKWDVAELGTNIHLTSVEAWKDQFVVCGFDGYLARGRNDEWANIDVQLDDGDFWALGKFGDRLFLLAETMVLEISDDFEVKPVFFLQRDVGIFHSFAINDSTLWAVGEKDIVAFDGVNWAPLLQV